jgi:hypothetical protein
MEPLATILSLDWLLVALLVATTAVGFVNASRAAAQRRRLQSVREAAQEAEDYAAGLDEVFQAEFDYQGSREKVSDNEVETVKRLQATAGRARSYAMGLGVAVALLDGDRPGAERIFAVAAPSAELESRDEPLPGAHGARIDAWVRPPLDVLRDADFVVIGSTRSIIKDRFGWVPRTATDEDIRSCTHHWSPANGLREL